MEDKKSFCSCLNRTSFLTGVIDCDLSSAVRNLYSYRFWEHVSLRKGYPVIFYSFKGFKTGSTYITKIRDTLYKNRFSKLITPKCTGQIVLADSFFIIMSRQDRISTNIDLSPPLPENIMEYVYFRPNPSPARCISRFPPKRKPSRSRQILRSFPF